VKPAGHSHSHKYIKIWTIHSLVNTPVFLEGKTRQWNKKKKKKEEEIKIQRRSY